MRVLLLRSSGKMATSTLIIFLTFILIVISPTSFATLRPFKKIYAFGDSYTDTGNTVSATGPIVFDHVSSSPYGLTYFHHPTNRYSDGRLIIDFVAEALSLPFLPPYLDQKADRSFGVNFAVAGATAIRHGFFVKNNLTLNIIPQALPTQMKWFSKLLVSQGCVDSKTTPKECKAALDDALIWVGEIGANDFSCSTGSGITSKTIEQLAMHSVTRFLQTMLSKGAKYVVFQGIPPMGCLAYSFFLSSPQDRDSMGCVASKNKQTRSYNAALQAVLNNMQKEYPQTAITYADFYNVHLTVMKNAKKYGIKELFKACCGYGGGQFNFDVFNTCGTPSSTACKKPSDYINWDGAHLTEAVYKVMADMFINGTYSRPPFKYLLEKKLQSG